MRVFISTTILLMCLLVRNNTLAIGNSGFKDSSVVILGNLKFLDQGDTIRLMVSNFEMFGPLTTSFSSTARMGHFDIRLTDITHPVYLNIEFPNRSQQFNLSNLLIEPGDSICFNLRAEHIIADASARDISFSGKGFEKLNIQRRLYVIQDSSFRSKWKNISQFIPSKNSFYSLDSIYFHQLAYLKTYKGVITNSSYLMLKIDLEAGVERTKYGFLIDNYYELNARKFITNFCDYNDKIWPNLEKKELLESGLAQYSWLYVYSLISKYITDICFFKSEPFRIDSCYNYFKANYKGDLREAIVTYLIYKCRFKLPSFYLIREAKNGYENQNMQYCLNDALTYVRNERFKALLNNLIMQVKGATGFNFSLFDTNERANNLSDFRGKVVLMDFWFTGCGNCRVLTPKLKLVECQFADNKNIIFISVSVDKDKEEWLESVKSGVYSSPDIINLFTNGLGREHPMISHYNIEGYPTLILIGKDGRLLDNPLDPRVDDGQDLMRKISAALRLLQ